jgi:hypothetical protein
MKIDSVENSHWYEYDEMRLLIEDLAQKTTDWDYFVPILGTTNSSTNHNPLQAILQQYAHERLEKIHNKQTVKDKVVIPINLYENHWVIIFIEHPQDAAAPTQMSYIDPSGNSTNQDVTEAIKSIPLYQNCHISAKHTSYQDDGINCGVWCIVFANHILHNQPLPEPQNIDINKERTLQQERLNQIQKDDSKSSYTL